MYVESVESVESVEKCRRTWCLPGYVLSGEYSQSVQVQKCYIQNVPEQLLFRALLFIHKNYFVDIPDDNGVSKMAPTPVPVSDGAESHRLTVSETRVLVP